PFQKGSKTYIDLKAAYMFESELFAGHHVTITDENTEKVIYDGELTEEVRIPFTDWKAGTYSLGFVLDEAFNNPQNKAYVTIQILPTQAEDVTIQYVDEDGATIHDSKQISGDVGDYYDAKRPAYQLTIPNYVLDQSKFPTNTIGTLTDEPQTVTYVYDKIDGAPVTVKYLDENGAELAKPDTLTGKIDSPYETTAKDISGWIVDETKLPTNTSGSFTADSQTVTYTYKTNQTKVTAHDSTIYVGDNWNAKDNFDTAYDQDGKEVPFDEVTVEGTVDTTKPGVYSVKYMYDGAETEINVTVKAKDVPVDPTNPIDPTKPAPSFIPNQPNQIKETVVQSEQSTSASQWKLPITGDNTLGSILYSVVGFTAIFLAISLLRRRKTHS
ncbi:cell wall surface anchor family protein, partial [Listeria ivanovii FSL F6-596]